MTRIVDVSAGVGVTSEINLLPVVCHFVENFKAGIAKMGVIILLL